MSGLSFQESIKELQVTEFILHIYYSFIWFDMGETQSSLQIKYVVACWHPFSPVHITAATQNNE